ncbi:MAG: hypothetical protein HYY63_02235 [Elusimicrobia bacterium]|nr:hypothetical protein [Elusimicrobiota bacterium]
MISILIGLLTVCLGAFGAAIWFPQLIFMLKGLLPISMVCGGLIAILAGISSLRK